MRRWLTASLFVLAGLLVVYAAYAFFVSLDNGTKVSVTIHAGVHKDGVKAGQMYFRCTELSGDGAAKDDTDQCTLTVHKRDKVTITLVNDDGAGRAHDLRLLGTPYLVFPAGIGLEAGEGSHTGTFTAWATGDYELVCEMAGHADAGMKGTLRVLD